jgi:hypothetical protein
MSTQPVNPSSATLDNMSSYSESDTDSDIDMDTEMDVDMKKTRGKYL